METINILCATDNNYAPYCGIMLTSLFESNKDCHFVVYVFEDGSLTEENVKKYHILAQKYGNEIVLKTIDEFMVRTFPINICSHITLPTYYRILAAKLLPKEMRKVIYLDCDIIVNGAINPFWNVNLDGYALGAVCSDFTVESLQQGIGNLMEKQFDGDIIRGFIVENFSPKHIAEQYIELYRSVLSNGDVTVG